MTKINKAISGLGRSLSKVIKPMVTAVKKIGAEARRFAKTKYGKVIITAVAIYFGGAALSGAMGGGAAAATGATGWAGAAQGLGGAWTGLMEAGSALAAGEFAQAGSALATGAAGGSAGGAFNTTTGAYEGLSAMPAGSGEFGVAQAGAEMGAEAAGAEALAAEAGQGAAGTWNAATAAPSAVTPSAVTPAATAATTAAPAAAPTVVNAATNPTMLQQFMSSKYAMPAAIQAGSTMLSSFGSAQAAQSLYERQKADRDAELERYSRNVGVRIRRAGT